MSLTTRLPQQREANSTAATLQQEIFLSPGEHPFPLQFYPWYFPCLVSKFLRVSSSNCFLTVRNMHLDECLVLIFSVPLWVVIWFPNFPAPEAENTLSQAKLILSGAVDGPSSIILSGAEQSFSKGQFLQRKMCWSLHRAATMATRTANA